MKPHIKLTLKEDITPDRVPYGGNEAAGKTKSQARIAPAVNRVFEKYRVTREYQPASKGWNKDQVASEIPMMHRNPSSTLVALLAFLLLFALPNATHAVEQAKAIFYMDINHDTNEQLVYDASDDNDTVDDRDGKANNIIANPDLRYYSDGETGKIGGRDWHGEISSLEIFGGAKVLLYKGDDYDSTGITFTSSEDDLRDHSFNDKTRSLKVILPAPTVTPTSLDFGDLYVESYDGASEYNEKQYKEVTLKNYSAPGTTLHWEITDADAILNVSPSSGELDGGESETITVWADPTSSGEPSGSFTIATSNGDKAINWSLTAYDTPSPSQIAPALGSNGRVNVGSGESHLFEVVSDDPSYPDADLKGYQWQMQRGTIDVDSTAWEPTSGNGSAQKQISLTDEGDWTVYARMVDDNKVATEPIEIPVTVWAQPVVSTAPPSNSSTDDWFTTYTTYVGVVNQPMTLQATSDLEPTFSASGLTTESQVGSGAGVFDGSTLVSIANRPAINDSFTDRTVALWFKTDDLTQSQAIIYEQGGSSNGVSIYLNGSDLYGGMWTDTTVVGSWLNTSTSGVTLKADRWYHVALVLDSDDELVELWLDGEQIGTVDSEGSAIDMATNGNGIGAKNDGTRTHSETSTNGFSGQIDDVGIFNRALLGTEIADLADETSFGLTGRPDDLEDSLVYFNTFDYDGASDNHVSRYLWFDSSDNLIATQLPGKTVDVTFSQQNLSGSLSCIAVTNHGIESDKQVFDLKVYPMLTVGPGGPYIGKPSQAVTLSGSANESGYPSAAFSYQWQVDTDGDSDTDAEELTESDSPLTEYTWSVDGEYLVALTATVTTQEGLDITASNTGSVTLESGVPAALPGGPYRGGISGGNFSPIQLQGNLPDFIEDADVGEITGWQWSSGPKETGLTLDGVDDHVEIGAAPFSDLSDWTIMAWVNPDSGQAHQIYSEGSPAITFNFRVQANGAITVATVNNDGWDGYTTSAGAVTFGEWNHIAATLAGGDDDVDSGTLTIYVNGAEVGSGLLQKEGAGKSFATIGENVGSTNGGTQGTLPFKGSIDDVVLFGRKLSQTEIQDIKENSLAGDELDLLAYWAFEEGTGTTTADVSESGNNGILVGNPLFYITITETNIYNPIREYQVAGTYDVRLRVQSASGKSSPVASTTITVVDGAIEGEVKAADLRTPVEAVTITLSSSHVDIDALSLVAENNTDISTTADGSGLSTETDEQGSYRFPNLPLGSYVLVASKGTGDDAHEFETKKQFTELTLDAPNQLAIDYTDLSVSPVGGQIYYSILKNGQKVSVQDVAVSAQPVGNASAIEALDSTTALDAKNQNYSMPLFAGKYLFKPTREGHDIRLVGTTPSTGAAIGSTLSGYDADTQLMTIDSARTDVDFVDYTTRTITVIVEDSGGFPIDTNTDGNQIEVSISGTNGAADGTVVNAGQALFTAVVPPGVYTIELPNVPGAIVKGNRSQTTAELDVTGGNDSVTMVVPVQIELSISEAPTLLGVNADFLEDVGLSDADNPEGFMFYYAPERQEHTYTITATANGNSVTDFRLEISDGISQESAVPAPTVTQSVTDGSNAIEYTVKAGIPHSTVVDEDNSETYVLDSDGKKLPKVLPKTITFKAFKDNYSDSELEELEVTVLGDLPEGSVSELVSIPNVNYFVLHDPPGDGSYSYLDESMTIKGLFNGMTIEAKNGKEIEVFPSPWSSDRTIDDVEFATIRKGDQNLGAKGLLDNRDLNDLSTAGARFSLGASAEGFTAFYRVGTGPLGYGLQFIAMPVANLSLSHGELVQYEVSPNRFLRTPIEDEIDDLPDKMGPGKGDLYYGEGWTLGLQTKYRLGIKEESGTWIPDTALILTYDILDVKNQYVYTVTDIERIIEDLDTQITALGTPDEGSTEDDELTTLTSARNTWQSLLENNPAYKWRTEHIEGDGDSDREALDEFLKDKYGEDAERELLLFNGGTEFEYSRTMTEIDTVEYSSEVSIGTEGNLAHYLSTDAGFKLLGTGVTLNLEMGAALNLGTAQILDKTRESGTETEQTVGFVLADGDLWDSITTYVYEGPWGTPIFFTDPGSVTSWPWQQGTVKGVDVGMELISTEDNGPFDYRDGAHYQFKVTSTGKALKEGSGFDYLFYDLPLGNPKNATVQFNGSDEAPYKMELFKGFSGSSLINGVEETDGIAAANANIMVSIYPPEKDWNNAGSFEYPVVVQSESAGDYQIAVNKVLRPVFADLRPPRATITAPYDGQRISPTVFTSDGVTIQVFSDDDDIAKIQLQSRTKQPDGVFQSWQNISGLVWEKSDEEASGEEASDEELAENTDVLVVTHTNRDPQRREFTFTWAAADVTTLGVGEYQLRAVAQDAATALESDAQADQPNVDLDPPVITFRVDASQPTVLTTTPFYQDSESQRIYRGELSASFTDDMTADDFSDRTFAVVDLLNDSAKVAGIVSYSQTLRKAIFTPVTPLDPNGFYKVTIKTDTLSEGTVTESGVHDLAGNPLDNALSWTFRTTDSPFEETWSIALSAVDNSATDAGKLAAVAFGALEGEDELDARAVPRMSTQLALNFLHKQGTAVGTTFERDTRPADGRLAHQWFFEVTNPAAGNVEIQWLPSLTLTRSTRQYQLINLVEFNDDGTVANTIALDPFEMDPDGSPVVAHTYSATEGESRIFRLDVMKSQMVATTLTNGSTGWKFFSAPITPTNADPFVNLGDDVDPLQLFKYDTAINGYNVYPFDLGQVSLQAGHGYFTRLEADAEVDIGGTNNTSDVTLTLATAGWHAIGNPFILPVDLDTLLVNGTAFHESSAVVETTLHRWNVAPSATDAYATVASDGHTDAGDVLLPWEGYFIKTSADDVSLTIPAPEDVENATGTLPDSFTPPTVTQHFKPGEFELTFALTAEHSADLSTALGTRDSAAQGYDQFDLSEPPQLTATASLYFEHTDWDRVGRRYNTDFKPTLNVGDTANWTVSVFTNKPHASMELSWADAIGQVSDDILVEFRAAESEGKWRDMRAEPSVSIKSATLRTHVRYDIRATRLTQKSLAAGSVAAGDRHVMLSGNALTTGHAGLSPPPN